MLTPKTPITALNPVGRTTASRLKRIGIETANDLLWHLPRGYEDVSQVVDLADAPEGTKATFHVRVEKVSKRMTRYKRMSMTIAEVADDTDTLNVIWFNQPYIANQLHIGDELLLAGEVKLNKKNERQLSNPTFEKYSDNPTHTARIVPKYPSTANITQKQLRFLIKQVLPLTKSIEDYIPQKVLETNNLAPLSRALKLIHFPKSSDEYTEAGKRLKFDELFLTSLTVQRAKQELQNTKAPVLTFQEDLIKKTVESLPFELTSDQRKVSWEILKNIASGSPMNRLVQGDVGSGKTVVAALALLNTAANNKQGILLAPTELLATQHFKSLQTLLPSHEASLYLLTRSTTKAMLDGTEHVMTKKRIREAIRNDKNSIIIGTHALLQDAISYSDIGLIVIDEQHRFGVKQRHALHDTTPEYIPHFLSMTATPIPRSLSLTLYGDLDISRIQTKPKSRKDIITRLVTPKEKKKEYSFIKKEIQKSNQVFVICPLIEESDTLGVASATAVHEDLSQNVFPEFEVGLLHGKLKKDEKEQIMNDFRNKKINMLVATSVIEVGVDVPDATVILIEAAERFGLAQLHQFRGRVGRSDKQSYCLLTTETTNADTLTRLGYLVEHVNGFEIAEKDLETRGPGDLYGYKQSGLPQLKIASLSDIELMKRAKQAVDDVLQNHSLEDMQQLQEKIAEQHAIHFE
ncbi:MAG: ATP-dependent DNA helicase RecG [Patescibacteria group bacterium]